MKKIILVLNSQQIGTGSVEFACYIANLTHSGLTGLFIEEPEFHQPSSLRLNKNSNIEANAANGVEGVVAEKTATKTNVQLFKEACSNRGVNVTVYPVLKDVVEKVRQESRFADVLIVDPATSFNGTGEGIPSHFVKQVLSNSECPVIIAPDVVNGIREIVFCYDGSASAVFAMKQFTYLFPEYSDHNVVILHIATPDEGTLEAVNKKIFDWLKPHYASVNFHILEGSVDNELFPYFLRKEKQFVVMGAYGRGLLSNFFKKSSADLIMRVIDLPLFITHH